MPEVEPARSVDLYAIEGRAEWFRGDGSAPTFPGIARQIVNEDVPALLAEVKRLRALIERAKGLRTSHIDGQRTIDAAVARMSSPGFLFYHGAETALGLVRRTLRGEDDG